MYNVDLKRGYLMKRIFLTLALSVMATGAMAEDFSVGFNWDGLKLCTSGRPNTVGNSAFELSGVPAGTKWLYFALTDFDARGYNHGGGWIEYDGNEATKADVFRYKSPCPPNGAHTYEWSVTATVAENLKNPLGVAASTKSYP